jgi:hypothetical protein
MWHATLLYSWKREKCMRLTKLKTVLLLCMKRVHSIFILVRAVPPVCRLCDVTVDFSCAPLRPSMLGVCQSVKILAHSFSFLGPPILLSNGYRRMKRSGREADHSSPSSAEVKECVELYLHSPVHLHGVVLS